MVESLCKYKDALGKPGQGAHSWRLGGLAGVDLLLTAGAALLISQAASGGCGSLAGFLVVFIILMIIAVVVHRAFCVDTALNRKLGISGN